MESKRKASSGGTGVRDDSDDRAAKRRKIPEDYGETPQTTTETGLKFLETIKKTEDKSGRLIATAFLELPNKRQLPDYYKATKLPISLNTIQEKLRRNEFPNLTALEAYFKRMIWNAKDYNARGSVIFEDAERLRKACSNYMTRTNPAYRTAGFQCNPTPLPGNTPEVEDGNEDAEGGPEEGELLKKKGRQARNSQSEAVKQSSTPALSESQYNGVGYSGLNFQQAQEKVLADMINYKEDPEDDFAGFEPFLTLPDRAQLKEYYQVIQHPVSLKQVQKRVKGVVGKRAGTGVSEFKHWAAFEEEMSFLWKNAFQFNEDDSPIYLLAKELQVSFYKHLKEAKQAVPEPAGPTKIKLKLPEPAPKITLKFGGAGKISPTGSPAPPTNGSNGSEISINGGRRNPFGGSSATPVPVLDQLERARSASGPVASPTPSSAALVKKEEGARNSPAIAPGLGFRAPSQTVSTPGVNGNGMLPPSTPGLAPILPQAQFSSSGYAQSFSHQAPSQQQSVTFESKWRQPGKDASSAMITNLSISTHPNLHISKHLQMNLPPSATKTQQSITINLPSSHYYLQIKPTIATSLRERQYKLFVTSGAQRLIAMPLVPNQPVDNLHPLFEARLLPGVNRIEIELIAALPRGAPKLPNGLDVELEKISIFANLLK